MNKQDAMAFLDNLITKLDTQDNRGTRTPIQFLLQTKRTIWGHDLYNSDVVSFGAPEEDYHDFESKKDLIRQLKEDGYDDETIEDINIERSEGQDYWHTEQAFLTEEALNEHVRINKHNLGVHRSYVIYAFRNREMEELYEAIRLMVKPDVTLDKEG